MRTTKILLSLLLSMTFLSVYAGKPKKSDPLLTGPFYIQPYFQAFGMDPEALDDSPASQGCVDVYMHQKSEASILSLKGMPKHPSIMMRGIAVSWSIIFSLMSIGNILRLKKPKDFFGMKYQKTGKRFRQRRMKHIQKRDLQ